MFKGHPKGLIVAFFTNMGERFGFYTMMAILVLFLQARYGLSVAEAGGYYSWFYFAIYALALIGGLIADWTKQYKTVIFAGQVVMFAGYALIAMPGMSLGMTLAALFVIALGNGLFKGNLQAVVGQLYDNEKYAALRDRAFMVFYMGINIGAFFAPFIATWVRNWWLGINGFLHDASLPSLCHQMIAGTLADTSQLQALANKAVLSGSPVTDLTAFAQQYIDVFARGYNWAFAVAAGAMVISLIVYLIFNKLLPKNEKKVAAAKPDKADGVKLGNQIRPVAVSLVLMAATAVLFHFAGTWIGMEDVNYMLGLAVGLFVGFVSMIFQISTKEERPRIVSLCLVFCVVIFFWMSFHQNGLTMTTFARDYTVKAVVPFTYLFFQLPSILCVIATIGGLVLALSGGAKIASRLIGGLLTVAGGIFCYCFMIRADASNPIAPEVFQSFNPLFIVALTPLVMGFFTWLANRGKEPSTPKKIGFGMIIAAVGFVILLVGSLHLVSPHLLNGADTPDTSRITPYWLISSYLVLTIAELFLSPMGLSFVSKVAPARFQGLMQGGWLLATAVGNKFLFVGSMMWGRVDLYVLWGIFVVCCIVSAVFIFSIMKRLEKATRV
ncbi:MAG: peptide MFS transporter [Rikenellaceae bacterium]|jgi:POT family proton-dependent oligopeptide transporter|nr:peptide MFS transporter [Rikenellaceae bacterium]